MYPGVALQGYCIGGNRRATALQMTELSCASGSTSSTKCCSGDTHAAEAEMFWSMIVYYQHSEAIGIVISSRGPRIHALLKEKLGLLPDAQEARNHTHILTGQWTVTTLTLLLSWGSRGFATKQQAAEALLISAFDAFVRGHRRGARDG